MTTTDYAQAYEVGFQKTVRFLLSRGVEAATAEESAQAAWARGWEKRKHLKEAKRVVQWVNTIALNIFRGRYRKESREEAMPVREFSVGPDNATARVDLNRSAESCSQGDWKLLQAHYMAGYSSNEIAEQTGLNPVTVRVRISRAKAKLRACLTTSSAEHGQLSATA